LKKRTNAKAEDPFEILGPGSCSSEEVLPAYKLPAQPERELQFAGALAAVVRREDAIPANTVRIAGVV
jgi:hypothetical protein